MRVSISRRGLLLTTLGFMALSANSVACATEGSDRPSDCARVAASAPIQFKGRTLVEAPDITEPELRRANVRAQALHILQFELVDVTQTQRDRLFSSVVEDNNAAIDDCALSMQAMDLIERRDDASGGAQLIERYLGKTRPCHAQASQTVRTLLAEAYLLQAARIAPKPAPANAALVTKAKKVLSGDLGPVAMRVAARRPLGKLIPFIAGYVDPDAVDDYGSSALCAAVRASNAPMVRQALREHADPNSQCEGSGTDTVLRSILQTATRANVAERQDMVRELLSSGARVEGMADSCTPADGDCPIVLLPILKEFEARRAEGRAKL